MFCMVCQSDTVNVLQHKKIQANKNINNFTMHMQQKNAL